MKVTFLLPSYSWGPVGGFRSVYEYANQLVARGYHVNLIYPRYLRNITSQHAGVHSWLRTEVSYLLKFQIRPQVKWQQVDRRVKIFYISEPLAQNIPNADIIFATAWQTAEYVAEYPTSKGKKFYLIQGYEVWNAKEERIRATWMLPFKKVVVSTWLYKKCLDFGIKKSEIVIIPNGVNAKQFHIVKELTSRSRIISMLYHIEKIKGFDDGIEALKEVYSLHKDFQVILFGVYKKPKLLPKWVKYIYNPSSHVLVNYIYNNTLIFVSSSWEEGFSMPPAEAMACGCAVVATDSGGIREYAKNGVTALLSPPKNPKILANNINRVLEDDTLRIELAKSGYEVIQKFTWERSADLLEDFLNLSEHNNI